MKIEATTLQELALDPVRDGLEELERYLRFSPRSVDCSRTETTTEETSTTMDDPLYVGLDRLERTLRAARLGTTGRC